MVFRNIETNNVFGGKEIVLSFTNDWNIAIVFPSDATADRVKSELNYAIELISYKQNGLSDET